MQDEVLRIAQIQGPDMEELLFEGDCKMLNELHDHIDRYRDKTGLPIKEAK